ncbi:MAG: hypothetical protein ACRDZQ_17185, partial [Acidimicrobiales bacterium]
MSPAHRRHRRWPFRVLIGANIVVLLCLVGAGAGYGYVRFRLGQIAQVSVPGLVQPGQTASAGAGDPTSATPAPPAGPPENFLLVGSDSRAGDTAAQAKQFGNASVVTGQRSDVIILVHVD